MEECIYNAFFHLSPFRIYTKLYAHYSHFKYIVMPFGLTNALFVFQHLMNDVFCEYLDDSMVCYINDILIFSKNMGDHECHVHFVLQNLQEVELYAKLKMCEFHQFEVEFLGYIIFGITFAWIFTRFKPLSIGLPQLLFVMFKVFLDLPIYINISLPIIL